MEEERKAVVVLPEKNTLKTGSESKRLFPKTEAPNLSGKKKNRMFGAEKALQQIKQIVDMD